MNVKIDNSWREHIGAEFEKPYFSALTDFVRHEYTTTTCYPPGSLIFNAFNLCPFDRVKVVILKSATIIQYTIKGRFMSR